MNEIERCDLGGFSVVLGDESSELLSSPNISFGLRREVSIEYDVTHRLMRPAFVVMGDPSSDNIISLRRAEASKVVEAFLFESSDPVFHVGIRLRSLVRRSNTSNIFIFPKLPELGAEFRIPVMNQEFQSDSNVFEPHSGIARLLSHPFFIGIIGNGTAKYLSGAQMNEDKKVCVERPVQFMNLLRKEIRGNEAIHAGLKKCLPRDMPLAVPFRLLGEDVLRT